MWIPNTHIVAWLEVGVVGCLLSTLVRQMEMPIVISSLVAANESSFRRKAATVYLWLPERLWPEVGGIQERVHSTVTARPRCQGTALEKSRWDYMQAGSPRCSTLSAQYLQSTLRV
jgi:hypothetical protein